MMLLVTQAGKRELEGHWVGLKSIDQDMTHTFSFPLARDGHMNPPNHRELNNVYVYGLTTWMSGEHYQ